MISSYLAFRHTQFMLEVSTEWQTTFKWLANTFMVISALIVSFSPELAGHPATFVGFLFGHILWAMSGWSMKDIALITLNVGFIPIDFYAILIRL